MPSNAGQFPTRPASPAVWYSYAVIRVVPRVERGEFINAGVIFFARTLNHLEARIAFDTERLLALAPEAQIEEIERHLLTFCAICKGDDDGGPMAELPPSERFHWLTAPRSTIIQTSPVHGGVTNDPDTTLEGLMTTFVHPPRDASNQ